MLIESTNLGTRSVFGGTSFSYYWGSLLRDPYSRDYHLHSGSNLLNELTSCGEFDIFGGWDMSAVHAGLSSGK
jgi:hypothetical protein